MNKQMSSALEQKIDQTVDILLDTLIKLVDADTDLGCEIYDELSRWLSPPIPTPLDREMFKNGRGYDLDPDVLWVLNAEEAEEVASLFNCKAFQAKKENGYSLIFHPCTKKQGFQLSFFDDKGVYMVVSRDTIDEIVDAYIDGNYHNTYTIVERVEKF